MGTAAGGDATVPLPRGGTRAASATAQALAPTQQAALVPAKVAVTETLVTPERAMLHDEAHRLRAFSGFLALLSLITLAMLAALGGDSTAKAMHGGAVAVTGVFSAAYYAIARDPATFKPAHALGLAHIAMLANISGFYYWGVFGPYAAIVPVASYVFATGASLGVFWSGLIVS